MAAYLDARPPREERVARLRNVFKLGSGQQQGGKKVKKQQQKGGEVEKEAEKAEEDLEHAIISRIAAKHVL